MPRPYNVIHRIPTGIILKEKKEGSVPSFLIPMDISAVPSFHGLPEHGRYLIDHAVYLRRSGIESLDSRSERLHDLSRMDALRQEHDIVGAVGRDRKSVV